MICIILVSAHSLEDSGQELHLEGVPKALMPAVRGKRILDHWWDLISVRQLFNEVYLVTNADKYKHFERWATASDFPVENIVNDGSTSCANWIGSVANLELTLRTKKIQDTDVFVIAGDMMRCQDFNFDLTQIVNYFKLKEDGSLAVYYELEELQDNVSRNGGIVELCPNTNEILKFLESPTETEASRKTSVILYGLRKHILQTIPQYLAEYKKPDNREFGRYLEWLINNQKTRFYGMKLTTGLHYNGLEEQNCINLNSNIYQQESTNSWQKQSISSKAYARVGLIGNPSDGFYGKTISFSIENFWAKVTITESQTLRLLPHPLNDPTEFGGLGDLFHITQKDGYLGGLRLLQAACKVFYQYCSKKGIPLPRKNFTLKYDTNIPRQVGLAGSSAIVTATLKCLMQFFDMSEKQIPKEVQPQLILDAEKEELHINAGLQDRVVQVYEGIIYMDFRQDMMESLGHGHYERMNVEKLPHFWLAYIGEPSDSGTIHSDVNVRWKNGDPDVKEAMFTFAKYTDEARKAIENCNWPLLGELMNLNFDLRQKIYGENSLGRKNLRMIEIGRQMGACVKFPGSGGAVLGLGLHASDLDILRKSYQQEGFVFVDLIPKL